MGGKKKQSLKQMERMQSKQGKQEKKKDKPESLRGKKSIGIVPPDSRKEKTISEIKKMKVLTPYGVASRFNVRISVAKDLLEELESHGAVRRVAGNHTLKIYKAVD